MIHLIDRADFARASSLNLKPHLRRALLDSIAVLAAGDHDLTDWTEFLIVQPGDTEEAIVQAIGFSPLVEPIDGARFGQPGFAPGWDTLLNRSGWFEMIVTFGSTFAYILLIEDSEGVQADLLALCRRYAAAKT